MMKRNPWAIVAIWLAVVFVVCAVIGAGVMLAGLRSGFWQAWSWRGFDRSYAAGMEDYTVDFDAPLPASLKIDMVSVDVRVVADDTIGPNIKARFEGRRSSGGENRIDMINNFSEVTFEQSSPIVNINWNWLGGGDGRALSGVLTVYVPSSGLERLDISNVSGDVLADGIEARRAFKAGTVSGGIAISGIKADGMTLGTVSGDIDASGVSAADVGASTVSGDISISNALSADASLSSTSGSISYAAPTLDNVAVNANSVSGGIRVGGARARGHYGVNGSAGSITAGTVSGRIDIE